jgi:hypothetical protein
LRVSPADNPAGQEQLQIFLNQTAKLVWQTRKDLSTQMSVNKTYAWQLTWPIRTMCTIMQFNSPELWKSELFCAHRLPDLYQRTVQLFREWTMEQIRRNEVQRTAKS